MYQNQPDPKVVAAEKAQKALQIKEAKAKALEVKSGNCCSSCCRNWGYNTIGTIRNL
jgi:hypothetical protein